MRVSTALDVAPTIAAISACDRSSYSKSTIASRRSSGSAAIASRTAAVRSANGEPDVVLRGPFVEYILQATNKSRIIAVQPKRKDQLGIGDRISLSWDPMQCHIFPAEG